MSAGLSLVPAAGATANPRSVAGTTSTRGQLRQGRNGPTSLAQAPNERHLIDWSLSSLLGAHPQTLKVVTGFPTAGCKRWTFSSSSPTKPAPGVALTGLLKRVIPDIGTAAVHKCHLLSERGVRDYCRIHRETLGQI